ncbi:SDR family oxidoreductase [Shewanella pneumatophori]|uniref:SDR family oxidoreductase n=1 Tax=Shewanella pneumatophori TaxID=314092 RepID=A0A9X1ZE85_9GAMM|nr:SDR family oxidoreductase [Shewanella pneumatophori]MCL1140679.1 SDR family oxidoreductase [Shewanella pneumatophori]
MIKTVGIVGCGWFGLPLAQFLQERGTIVYGSKRSQSAAEELSVFGINGFQLDLDDDEHLAQDSQTITNALNADCLVVNIPPGLRKAPNAYLQRLAKLKQLIAGFDYKRLIFVSTTGVYPAINGVLTEKDAQAHSPISEKLLQAEQLFSDQPNICVVRFAGLVGPQRHPGRFLAGKKELTGGMSAVNIVHLNDCIAAVTKLIFESNVGGIYNVCAPEHPTRQDFYVKAANMLGLTAPDFAKEEGDAYDVSSAMGKLICSQRLVEEINFEYQFCDPMDMLEACE